MMVQDFCVSNSLLCIYYIICQGMPFRGGLFEASAMFDKNKEFWMEHVWAKENIN